LLLLFVTIIMCDSPSQAIPTACPPWSQGGRRGSSRLGVAASLSASNFASDDSVSRRKVNGVADALNRLLQNIVLKCAKAYGVRDFFRVGMIRYGGCVDCAR
jgi:hypothetical protein